MTAKLIIDHLGRMKQLHESLLVLSRKKTEALKTNDMDALQLCLSQERKHVSAINSLEKKRSAAVKEWAAGKQGFADAVPKVSDIIKWSRWPDREQLEEVYNSFILVLADLKQQEVLNGELTKQSLQFINMSLDLLQPSLNNLNYGHASGSNGQNRSVFDSQA